MNISVRPKVNEFLSEEIPFDNLLRSLFLICDDANLSTICTHSSNEVNYKARGPGQKNSYWFILLVYFIFKYTFKDGF
jgi:hypothetical protein